MIIASIHLSDALQSLVDCRLDTIDRMLLGRVPRQDRIAIVREVESQVFELLHAQGDDELSREDVLAVLARLDPPEAYLADADDEKTSFTRPRAAPPAISSLRKVSNPGAKASGILGIAALTLAILSPLIFMLLDSLSSVILAYLGLFVTVGTILCGSVLAFVLGAMNRRRGTWPIIGLFCGILAILTTIAIAGVLVLMR